MERIKSDSAMGGHQRKCRHDRQMPA